MIKFSFYPHLCRGNDRDLLEVVVRRHDGIGRTWKRKTFNTLRNLAADQKTGREKNNYIGLQFVHILNEDNWFLATYWYWDSCLHSPPFKLVKVSLRSCCAINFCVWQSALVTVRVLSLMKFWSDRLFRFNIAISCILTFELVLFYPKRVKEALESN